MLVIVLYLLAVWCEMKDMNERLDELCRGREARTKAKKEVEEAFGLLLK